MQNGVIYHAHVYEYIKETKFVEVFLGKYLWQSVEIGEPTKKYENCD